jgi:hypothetical protein
LKIPALESFSPRLQTLRSKRAELQIAISQGKAECAVIRARLQDAPNAGNESEVRIRKILGETPVETTISDPDRLRTLILELEDLNVAASVIDAAIQNETRTASNLLLESVKPEALRLGSDFAKAFLALRFAHSEYNKFVDEVDATSANVESLRLYPAGLSDPNDRSSNYAYGLREFANAGYLKKSEAPEFI